MYESKYYALHRIRRMARRAERTPLKAPPRKRTATAGNGFCYLNAVLSHRPGGCHRRRWCGSIGTAAIVAIMLAAARWSAGLIWAFNGDDNNSPTKHRFIIGR